MQASQVTNTEAWVNLREEVQQLHQALVLKTKHCNEHHPIFSQIPDYILVEIFQHLIPTFSLKLAESYLSHYRDSSRDMRRVSQVCSHWREVCVTASTLWAPFVDLRAPMQWLFVVAGRVKRAPAILTIDKRKINDARWVPITALGLKYHSIYLYPAPRYFLRKGTSVDGFQEIILKTKPTVIDTLYLHRTIGAWHHDRFPKFESGHIPLVRKLLLINSMMDFDDPVFQNLTILDIEVQAPGLQKPTVKQWITYLHGLPLLQSLRIAKAIGQASQQSDGQMTSKPAHLRHISSCTILDDTHSDEIRIDRLLSHIIPGNPCSLFLSGWNSLGSDSQESDMYSALNQWFANWPVFAGQVNFRPGDRLRIHGSLKDREGADNRELAFRINLASNRFQNSIHGFDHIFRETTSLIIWVDNFVDIEQFFFEPLRSFPRVEQLYLMHVGKGKPAHYEEQIVDIARILLGLEQSRFSVTLPLDVLPDLRSVRVANCHTLDKQRSI